MPEKLTPPLTPFRLDLINPGLRDMAVEDLANGDISGFLFKAEHGNQYWMDIVHQNICALRERGWYEKALYEAFISTRTHNLHLSPSLLHRMFSLADRERLRAVGDPFPGPGPFTLYRGVAGKGPARRVKGLSWTASFERAKWFAQRWQQLPEPPTDPAVFSVAVETKHVYFYTNERQEEEFAVSLPGTARPKRVWRQSELSRRRSR